MPFCASSEGSGEFTFALFCCLKWRFVCCSCQPGILWWFCTFAQAKSLDNAISIKISCVGSKGSLDSARLHRADLSLRHSIEISCAGWNRDFCNVYLNSECCGKSAPATTALLCNHQCVVQCFKMLPVRCYKNSSIKHLLVYQEKNKQSGYSFLDVISLEYDNSCA